MEDGWSARRVAHQLGCFDCIVKRCCNQWIRKMSFTRKPGSGRPRQTSHREDRHIIRNARVQPISSPAAIQAQVVPSLGAPVSSRTMRRHLAEGHLGSRCPLRVLPLTPFHRRIRLEWCRARGNWTDLVWNQVSLATNPDSISAVLTIVFVCGDPVVNASILPLLYSDTPLPQLL
ncbi:HTH_Tnp_Tc3_2 domain-containing protein [Trichonephila clavipes]|nr:HTH_Tnp_Tc3_2 domain-containing protein [Trichonephila clavipes]